MPEWARAHGEPILQADIRQTPEEFQVTEELGFEPSGDGEHDFLWIEKRGANTAWVARQLARHAKLGSRDVGYSGLKDRHALTRQWFSVRRPNRDGTDWQALGLDGVRIVERTRNARKLRRGAHRSNRFRIALRASGMGERRSDLLERVQTIRQQGVPNYFGPQRFGRDGGNIALAEKLFAGGRLNRDARSHALSAARSLLFNAILDNRVRSGSWNTILEGELANLDASGSVFAVDAVTKELARRCRELDIHPSATLWGKSAPLTTAEVAQIERRVVEDYAQLGAGIMAAGVDSASRALRVRVADISVDVRDDIAWLEFRLTRGAFATAVIRELVAGTA